MNIQVIRTLVVKEVMIFFRNKFFAVITALALVFYLAIYFALPSTVDVEMEIGLYAEGGASQETLARFEANYITIVEAESEEALTESVEDGDYPGGLVLSDDQTDVKLYLSAKSAQEVNDAVEVLINMAFSESRVNLTFEVLGYDLGGESLAMRERMLPLFAVLVLIMEVMGLSTLIAEERSNQTVQALLVTPMSIGDFFIGKGIMGVGLAFSQAFLIMLLAGGLSSEPLPIIAVLFFGAMLVTGIGFLIGSVGRDMMSNIGWMMLAIFVLIVPALTVMFPGTSADWLKIIPSYYIVDTVHRVVNFGAVWGDVWQNIVILSVFAVAFLALGVEVLRRRLA